MKRLALDATIDRKADITDAFGGDVKQ